MADNKKYYWLKLNEDFFDEDTIAYIEEQENGVIYSNFYLKLCLKSLKSNGVLIRTVGDLLIPYDAKSLAKLTGVDVDVVKVAMDLFMKIGLIQILDSGEIYLSQMNELIGSETEKAKQMRIKRAKEKKMVEMGNEVPQISNNVTKKGNNVTKSGNNVTEVLPKCYTEIEKEIEKEIDIEKDIEIEKERKVRRHKYGEYHNVLLSDEELERLKEEFNDYEDRIERLSEYIASSGKKYKSHLATIRAWAKKEKPKEDKKYKYNLGVTL